MDVIPPSTSRGTTEGRQYDAARSIILVLGPFAPLFSHSAAILPEKAGRTLRVPSLRQLLGDTISTFPYNLDVIAKIISIRDFFLTLFLAIAALAAVFLMASRFLAVYPLLYTLRNGHRVSLLTAINLSQAAEVLLSEDAEAIAQLKQTHVEQLQAREEVVS